MAATKIVRRQALEFR